MKDSIRYKKEHKNIFIWSQFMKIMKFLQLFPIFLMFSMLSCASAKKTKDSFELGSTQLQNIL
jgi:hypothetical protein